MCKLSWTPHSNLEKDNSLNHSCVSPRKGCLEYKNIHCKNLRHTLRIPHSCGTNLISPFSIYDLNLKPAACTYRRVSACCYVSDWLCRWRLFRRDRSNPRPSPRVLAVSFSPFSLSLFSSGELLNTENIEPVVRLKKQIFNSTHK